MKNTLKSLAVIFTAVVTLGLSACGKEEPPKEQATTPPQEETTPPPPAPPPVMTAEDSAKARAQDSINVIKKERAAIEKAKQDSIDKKLQDSLAIVQRREDSIKIVQDSLAVIKAEQDSIAAAVKKAKQDSVAAVEKEEADERYTVAKSAENYLTNEITLNEDAEIKAPIDYVRLMANLTAEFSKSSGGKYIVKGRLEEGTNAIIITVSDKTTPNKKTILKCEGLVK